VRISIETTERGGIETPIYEPTQPAQVETMDGGAPSETLIQTIAKALPASTERAERAEIDGGSPPEWLVEAIQGATQLRTEGSSLDIDAGGAPSSEG
jgi:hypothetical protein